MFESLFGAEMPLAVRFFLAFLIVLGVIGAIWWTVRRFSSGRLGTNTRGRQPRLAVIDYASVDNRRRLILVRRDNVEHLLMIGGPSDIVVEPNIVRAVPAARDIGRAPAGIEAITRAIPLPDNGGGSWPLQPEANGGSRPGARPDAQHDELSSRPQPESGPRQRDTLAALADELSTRSTPQQRNRGNAGEPPRQEQRQEQRQDQRQEQRQEQRQDPRHEQRQDQRQDPRHEQRQDQRHDPRHDQRHDQRQDQRAEPRLEPRRPLQPAAPLSPQPTVVAGGEPAAGADQNLADMAQRLEAALRKPPSDARAPAGPARAAAGSDQPARSDSLTSAPPRNPRGTEQRPAPTEANKPNQTKTAIYDTLEQEMANLLGRPPKN